MQGQAANSEADLETRIAAGRIESLIRQQSLAVPVTLVNSVLVFVLLMGTAPTGFLSAWLAAIWAATGIRAAIWLRLRGKTVAPDAAAGLGRRFTVIALGSGLLWGLPGLVMFPESPIALQGFLVFVLGGMSAGAVATLSSHMPAFCAFLLPTLAPVIARLFYEGGQGGMAYVAMGTMGLIYLLVLLATARSLNEMLSRSLALQLEKSDLAETLAAARTEAEAASIAKSEFLAMVSHELRTPLNAVLGFSELLERQVHGPLGHARYRDYVQHIRNSGNHLMHLIDDLLCLSRAGSGGLTLVEDEIPDLEDFLKQCAGLLKIRAAQKRQVLTVVEGRRGLGLRADPVRLRQIVLNVLSNAIKFTPDGGETIMTIRRQRSGGLSIVVRDTGIGMSEQELKVALESFGRADSSHSRSTEGAGIGLPLTASLMKLHQGEIEIVSRPNTGTKVSLRFPPERVIDGAGAAELQAPREPREQHAGHGSISVA
ncbi:MAG: HAMP domain-containing sensor histidine kinase [Kiloniellales bacterium]|nr:HAMP domain-containing sensor histidine kinase [Kiloniellales bacterium]